MLKSSRPLSRSLVLSAALAVGMPSVIGCEDPNDPSTYVKQLEDPGRRTAAVDRLVTFFDDAYSKDRSADESAEPGATAIGPNVKAVLDKIISPLTELCIKGELDEKSHAKVVKFAAATRDQRADPCILATLKNYKLGSTEANVKEAVRSVAATGSKEAAPAVFEVFQKMRASNER